MNAPSIFQQLLPEIVLLGRKAGEAIMEIYAQTDFQTTYKDGDSPLTLADMVSHDLIIKNLETLTPEIPVLSEESKTLPYEVRQNWHTFWLVDPLDGTKEFIKRNGEFTVNIALIENQQPVLGVVHAPALSVTYYAARGVGAFKRTAENGTKQIAAGYSGSAPLRVVASRSHAGRELEKFLDRIGPVERISMGSSLKFCLVAEGAAHLYPRLGPTMEWDTAAAQCVVEMAGGALTDLLGHALTYNKPDLLNPHFVVSGIPALPWHKYLQEETASPQGINELRDLYGSRRSET